MPEAFSLRLDNEQVPFSNLVEIVQWHLQRHPDREVFQFLKDGEVECHPVSYFELDQKAKEIAVQLLSEAQCGDRALLVLQNGIDFITGFFGCLYAGICAVPVYPPQNRQAYLERLEMIATDCQARFVLGTRDYFDNAQSRLEAFETLGKATKIAVDEREEDTSGYVLPALNQDSLAFLQYTSGSTSAPKGVMVTHGNLINNIASMQSCFGHDEQTIIASWLPMFHDMGLIGAVLQPICIGGKVIAMTPAAFLQKPMRWLDAISKYRATSSFAPNFAYDLCVSKATEEDLQRLDLSTWTMALNGAEPIKPETVKAFANKFAPCGLHANTMYPGYGLAEATLFVSGAQRLSAPQFLEVAVSNYQHRDLVKPVTSGGATRELVSSGIPSPYNDVVIVDPEDHSRLADGQVGEVWVRGENVASGYWQNEEKTIETFRATIRGEDDVHYMRTGDLGFIHQQHLFICGRIKELIIIRGANFYPQNIEQTLQNNIDGLKPNGGAAFTIEHEGEDALVIVQEVERTWLKKVDPEAVAQQARALIASEYGLSLHAFVMIRPMTLPKTSSGKIQRARAKQYFASGELKVVSETIFTAASKNSESAHTLDIKSFGLSSELADVVLGLALLIAHKAKLPVAQLDIEQSIILTGLDSITLNSLVATVKNVFGVTLSLGELLQSSSLLDIAQNIVEQRQDGQSAPLLALKQHNYSQHDAFDLSVNQMQMWLLHQKTPHSAAYNVPMCLQGQFDKVQLELALTNMLDANPILRTHISFNAQQNKWQQRILPMPEVTLIEHSEVLASAELARSTIAEAAQQPFDLEHEPCYRFELFPLEDGSQCLLLTFHHMVVDLTSMLGLTKALLAQLSGQGVAPLNTSASYQDFIAWQCEQGESEKGQNAARYWQEKLAADLPALQWPMRNSQPQMTPGQGTSFEFASDFSSAELSQACKQLGCTQNSFIFSAYQLFLTKLCHERQFAVGILNTGRIAPEFLDCTGYFVEPQVFLANVGLNASFCELVAQTQQQLFTMVEHAGSSLQSMLAQESKHEQSLQTLFTFYPHQAHAIAPFNAAMEPRVISGCEAYQHIPLPSLGAQFDLSLIAADDGEQLQFRFEYHNELFNEQHIAKFAEFFSHVMGTLVKQPNLRSEQLALQPTQAHDHACLQASFTTKDFAQQGHVHELFTKQAQRNPDAIACRFGNESLRYSELEAKANGLAKLLIEKTNHQDPVGIYAERSLELVVAIVACLKAGCPYVPIDPTQPDERVATIIDTAKIALLLSNQPQLPCDVQNITLDVTQIDSLDADAVPVRTITERDLAYIIFTSGSTGTPKGVMNNHGAIRNRVLWMQDEYQVTHDDVILQKTPYTFDVSVWEFLLPLISGATLVLAKPQGHKDSDYLSDLIAQQGVTLLHFVPSMLEVYLGNPNTQLASVRDVFCSGEALSVDLQNRFFTRFAHSRLHNLYGPTEAAIDVTYWQCDPHSQSAFVPIGRAIDNIQLYVLDAELQPVPAGCLGELYIGGIGLANGYVNQPELTANTFIDNPFVAQADAKMYRTGDLVRYEKNGVIEYVGRTDSQVKVRGFRIELGDIDAHLLAIDQVLEAVTIVVGEGSDKQLASYVVLNSELDSDHIKAMLGATLPQYMVPTYITVMDTMPINANGKLDRKALPAPQLTLNESDYVAPESEHEQQLANIWAQVLNLDVSAISRTHNFFDLGGHSLAAAKVATLAKLTMRNVFDAPVLAQQAQYLDVQATDVQAPITKIERDSERFALSPAQSRLWFLNQFQDLGGAYNIPTVLQLTGQLDEKALLSSIEQVVARHEILRTCYASEDNVPYQYVVQDIKFAVEQLDWSSMNDAQRDDARAQFMAQHAQSAFDLATELPIRVALIKEQANCYTLCICLHHISADGVSLALLLQQISAYYMQQECDLEAPQLQYLDYCQWQAKRLSDEAFTAQQLTFWTKQLQGLKPLLPLPTDRPRPAQQTTAGECVALNFDNEVVAKLQRIATEHNASLYMVLMSAYKLLLSIYSKEQDIAVGTPVLGRGHTQLDDVFGFFANTVVLRNEIDSNATFAQLLAQVKETTLAAFEHQDLPLDMLIEALQIPRSSSYSPLFQVMFSLEQQQDVGPLFGQQLKVARVSRLHQVAKFDLSMMLEQHNAGVSGYLEFNTDLFDKHTIAQFAKHFTALLGAISTRYDLDKVALKELNYLQQPELELLAQMSEGPAAVFSSVTEQFDQQVACHPNKVAVSCGDSSMTYQQLAERANQIANVLIDKNITGAVGVSLKPSCEAVVALLAVLKAGAHYVPLDSQLPAQRMDHIVNESAMSHVLVDDASEQAFSERNVINVHQVSTQVSVELKSSNCADDLAYLMFTSGSTGAPKGITIRHGSITRLVKDASYVELNEHTVMLQAASLSFDAATFEIWGALLNGGRLVVHNDDVVSCQSLQALNEVNTAWLTASLFHQLVDENPHCLASLKQLLVGGDVVSAEHVAKAYASNPNIQIINGYGPTESTTFAATHRIHAESIACPRGSIAIGKPINGTQLYVLDAHQRPVPFNVAGELYIGGLGLATGYINQPQLNEAQFVECAPLGGQPQRLYRSGDLVRRLPSGDIEFIGRADEQVKLRGFRIELAEIDAVLAALASVDNCVTVLVDDMLVSYVVAKQGVEALREQLQQVLPSYMVPTFIIALDSLPLTHNGKLDRRALPDYKTFIQDMSDDAPVSEQESALAALWAQLLPLGEQAIGRSSDFFALGGHSLLAAKLVAKCNKELNMQLSVREIFDNPTLSSMAGKLQPLDSVTPLTKADRKQSHGLSYAQSRLWFLSSIDNAAGAYNVPLTIKLSTDTHKVDVSRLRQAVHKLVARHEVLRTAYRAQQGVPKQEVMTVEAALAQLDIPLYQAQELEHSIEQFMHTFNGALFDLSNGLPIRAAIVQESEDTLYLALCIHHIATDGSSMALIGQELAELYQQDKAELAYQYLDYSQWQQATLEQGKAQQQLAYWQAQLADLPPRLELPADYARPAEQSYQGACLEVSLPEQVSASLERVAHSHGCSMYMVMLAAYQLLLAKYAGEQDIAVGTPIANRPLAELESMVGFFANTLVLRNQVNTTHTLPQLLEATRKTTLSAYAHQDLPFEYLVEKLQPQRSLSYSPLFQVMFSLAHDDQSALEFAGLRADKQQYAHQVSKFDLSFMLSHNNGAISGYIEYSTDLYRASTIARMWRHYVCILEQLESACAQQSTVGSIVLDYPQQLDSQYAQLNGVVSEQAATPAILAELFAQQCQKTPNKVAVQSGDEHLTYEDLAQQVNVVANRILATGVEGNRPVAVYLTRSIDLLITLLAIQQAGAFYVPLDPNYPPQRVADILADAQPALIVTQQGLAQRLADVDAKMLYIDEAMYVADFTPCTLLPAPTDTAYAIYTSGSTGKPKGIAISHHNVAALIDWATQEFSAQQLSQVLAATSICFDLSVFEMFVPLCVGGCVNIVDDALALANGQDYSGLTLINTVPSAMTALLSLNKLPTSVSTINLAGEPLARELVDALYERAHVECVYNLYGPSEDTTYSTYVLVPKNQKAKPTIGRPIKGTQAYVMDSEHNRLPIGVTGELYLAGDGVTQGYLNNPAQTQAAYLEIAGTRMYKTGDKVRLLDSYELDYLGRIDHQVKLRGFRIELAEIEHVIHGIDAVKQCVVVVNQQQAQQPQLVAFVTLHDDVSDATQVSKRIAVHTAACLPDYMQPAHIATLSELPMLPNGKIARGQLAQQPIDIVNNSSGERPSTESGVQLAALWAELIGSDDVYLSDHFFELGGHSLLAAQLVSRVEELFAVQLTIKDVFQHPTLQAQIDLIALLKASMDVHSQACLDDEVEQQEGSI
ncbi:MULTISPECIES: non-ribosomal peptide synthetase [Pseudoalteromonas]|uniref:Carrier domain-containing protein n=1 Tax=Pseudoalteromonas amylolytica TaxID=1859457 RepID=A0A1S1MZJ2_9GAMM|nr:MULTISPECIES: non-ribosomal peptide synthetase [Pseudoalteromonas]OHU90807.1 hypothetical protein BFC16_04195 [Pseudoalteromonas sp. JW3]OHU92573.1 hypothetical protein BET10_03695 [Pseudoalteromonas amylolytica]